jgi:hypothetical protein
VTFEEFRTATAMLREVGYPVDAADDTAWLNFRGWRVNYGTAALLLARQLDAPPALWTGPRRWPSTPIPPARPPIRTPPAGDDSTRRSRQPEAPE